MGNLRALKRTSRLVVQRATAPTQTADRDHVHVHEDVYVDGVLGFSPRLRAMFVKILFFLSSLALAWNKSAVPAAAQEEDPQLSLLEAIRSDQPEQLFELLKSNSAPLPENRSLALQALAHYRLGEFAAAGELVHKMAAAAPEALLIQSLLSAAEGRFEHAEKSVSAALARRSELGLLFFEAGLHDSYLLQHLGRPEEAAAVVEQLISTAPFGRSQLQNIVNNLKAAPGEPYLKEATAADHTVSLQADGSTASRAVLALRANEPGQLVLFDTGSTLTLLKTDIKQDRGNGVAVLGLDRPSDEPIQYGWQTGLAIAGWKIANIPAGFVDKNSTESPMGNYSAVFGLPLLRRFFLVIDFPKRTLQLMPRPPDSIEGDRVPFRYVADQVIIPATINGKSANLLLDTGVAVPSLKVDISWAKFLAPLPQSPVAPGNAANQKEAAQERAKTAQSQVPGTVAIQVRSLKFGKQEMKELPVTVTSLRSRLTANPLATRIDAILGAPQLSEYRISIDFQKNWIYFQK
ncbi:MAG TPA: aspartyl protease family protein [Acidobacteriota bacterium]|jgi:tetratricopeptide (TPR) repeat protein|nr:aspartyl protease family protein [Acidobacteriota bacterium]